MYTDRRIHGNELNSDFAPNRTSSVTGAASNAGTEKTILPE